MSCHMFIATGIFRNTFWHCAMPIDIYIVYRHCAILHLELCVHIFSFLYFSHYTGLLRMKLKPLNMSSRTSVNDYLRLRERSEKTRNKRDVSRHDAWNSGRISTRNIMWVITRCYLCGIGGTGFTGVARSPIFSYNSYKTANSSYMFGTGGIRQVL